MQPTPNQINAAPVPPLWDATPHVVAVYSQWWHTLGGLDPVHPRTVLAKMVAFGSITKDTRYLLVDLEGVTMTEPDAISFATLADVAAVAAVAKNLFPNVSIGWCCPPPWCGSKFIPNDVPPPCYRVAELFDFLAPAVYFNPDVDSKVLGEYLAYWRMRLRVLPIVSRYLRGFGPYGDTVKPEPLSADQFWSTVQLASTLSTNGEIIEFGDLPDQTAADVERAAFASQPAPLWAQFSTAR